MCSETLLSRQQQSAMKHISVFQQSILFMQLLDTFGELYSCYFFTITRELLNE